MAAIPHPSPRRPCFSTCIQRVEYWESLGPRETRQKSQQNPFSLGTRLAFLAFLKQIPKETPGLSREAHKSNTYPSRPLARELTPDTDAEAPLPPLRGSSRLSNDFYFGRTALYHGNVLASILGKAWSASASHQSFMERRPLRPGEP